MFSFSLSPCSVSPIVSDVSLCTEDLRLVMPYVCVIKHNINISDVIINNLEKAVIRICVSRQIKLVNINTTDVVDGRPSIVLGLIWTIILYFQARVY